ncbi:MAG: murein biosynthesis integral membrane protein MurJ [Chloroflexi bacterium]|nr:murein biosynthesis integral membrane protein MurJ [Ktedonobacteraceae bacterium]MBV9019517.1 murein biosynthesis integral membrane protein MurJ [Ktedonobacteraceae bacterium]MBV9708893.1 murein biosynthesis integral membrane protein MurJ [Chloroflexota bacterium]
MTNEGQQPPLPSQGIPSDYSSWQYDQEQAEGEPPPQLVLPLHQPPSLVPPDGSPPLPARYQESIHDMGTSLGYGQGMEYQYLNAPQPSQPIPQLHQERLQQLRAERLRRQQRRMSHSDITEIARKNKGVKQTSSWTPSPPSSALFSAVPDVSAPSSTQASPMLSPPAAPSADEPLLAPEAALAASAQAQDTGMMQRARIGRAAFILTGAFVASRVLGLLRTSMFAYVFGASGISDIYYQSFLVPDLIFNIVAGGALSSAFIPVFTKYMVGEKDTKTAWHIASAALNLAITIMIGLAFIAALLAPQLVPLYNSALIHQPQQMALVVSLTRIMLLQSIVLGVGVIVNSVLNARQNFALPAIGIVLYNVGLIIGLLPGVYFAVHGRSVQTDIVALYAATWGVVLAALLQVGVQIPGLFKVGLRYTLTFDWHHPGIMQIGRQMVPRIINAAMLYFSIFVDRILIQLIATNVSSKGSDDGSITQYYQAFQLMMLPLGIFGMSVATAAFPTLAEYVAKGRLDRVRNIILETLRSILFLSIPSSIGLIVLALPIIQVLLEHGRFSLADAQATAIPLAFFALGLAGLAAVEILTRSFYALRDSVTPVMVSVGQFIFKIALSLVLINVAVLAATILAPSNSLAQVWGTQWGVGALAFSTSIAGLLEAGMMFWLLHQRLEGLQVRAVGTFLARAATAAVVMGICVFFAHVILDSLLNTTHTVSLGVVGTLEAIIKLLIELFVGVFVYLRVARMLGIEELGPIKRVLDRLKLSWI